MGRTSSFSHPTSNLHETRVSQKDVDMSLYLWRVRRLNRSSLIRKNTNFLLRGV
jgi:hypothetical protein